ncbi:MAG: CheR family methyltransferase [Polyangiaceae bacterium]
MNEDPAILMLIHRIAERIGYRAEAIPYVAAVKALKSRFPRGLTPRELERRTAEGDPELERALLESVSVGETFFFRQPDQFRYLAETHAARFTGDVVRAWSAGCATGEETYSLAACLLASVREGTRVEVLGTDVAEKNVLTAVRGVYGGWSVREAGPLLFPPFAPSDPGMFVVSNALRSVTTFRTHNVLEEPPAPGAFDVVFCRNVLLYFAPDAVEAACERLVSALVPGGLLGFGTLDVVRPPAGTEPVGPRGANLFVRVPGRRTRAPKRSVRARTSRGAGAPDSSRVVIPQVIPPPVITPAPEIAWIDDHMDALAAIEESRFEDAERMLDALHRRAPSYLPAIFELGVLLAKRQKRARAEGLMREVLRLTEGRDPHDPVPGPEELTVAYYRVAAEAYLGFAPGAGR